MASRTQLRLGQLTGSFKDVAGGMTDTRAAGNATLANIELQSGSMVGVMSEVISSIKRLHGAGSFAANAAGEFSQAITPNADDGAALGSSSKNWSDLFLADGAVVNLGDDQDVTLTHVHDTGLLLNSSRQLQFNDSGTLISSPSDGALKVASDGTAEIEATTSIQLDSPIVDLEDDGVVLQFGADDDVTLTHVHDAGLLLNSSRQIQFGDSATHIKQASDSNLEVEADGSIILDSPSIDFEDDGVILKFGDDSEVTLTHVHNQGLILSSGDALQFGDAGESITGDGTDLAIDSSNNLNVTAANNIVLDAQGTDSGDGVIVRLGADSSADVKFTVENDSGTDLLTVDGNGDATLLRNLTVTGNLDVNGSTTTIDSANTTFEDSIIGLGVSGSNGSFNNVGQRAVIFAKSANAHDALPALNYDGTNFELAKYLASPASASMGSASAYVGLKVGSVTSSALTDNRVVIAGASGVLEDDANLTFDGSDLQLGNNIGLVLSTDDAEKIESDGTDISISVGAGGDINIPANIGLTFGDDGEKIEGDGTDLTISGNNINLTAVADINIPADVGLTFASAEKIESDGTDLSITVGAGGDVNLPQDIGLTFGNDGEKIEGNGTQLTISSRNTMTLDSAGGIVLDADGDGEVLLQDGGSTYGFLKKSNTELVLSSSGGDIELGLAGQNVTFKKADTPFLQISESSADAVIKPSGANKDLIIQNHAGREMIRVDSSAEALALPTQNAAGNAANTAILSFNGTTDVNEAIYGDGGALYLRSNAVNFKFPTADASTAGFAMISNGAGTLSFAAVGSDAILKGIKVLGSAVSAGTAVNFNSVDAGSAISGMSTAENQGKSLDVFVNGQLLVSGSEAQRAAASRDYAIASATELKFAFALEADDVVQVIKR